jgi:putative NADH-flavin reductase
MTWRVRAIGRMIADAMPDKQKAFEDLAKAERDIAEREKRVAAQIAIIARMTEKGQDTTEAQKLLQDLEKTLKQFRTRRQLIVDALTRR